MQLCLSCPWPGKGLGNNCPLDDDEPKLYSSSYAHTQEDRKREAACASCSAIEAARTKYRDTAQHMIHFHAISRGGSPTSARAPGEFGLLPGCLYDLPNARTLAQKPSGAPGDWTWLCTRKKPGSKWSFSPRFIQHMYYWRGYFI